jgi:DNA-binding NtrC family response regulator
MDATASVTESDEYLNFPSPVAFPAADAPFALAARAGQIETEERDFDSFVEEQLRDGTGTLYADAMTWMERRLLVRVLAQTNGNKSKACQILGITRGSLRHKICQLGISIQQTVSVNDIDGR